MKVVIFAFSLIILIALMLTFYYYNKEEVLQQPLANGILGPIAPVGAHLQGVNNVYFTNGVYYLNYSNGNDFVEYSIDTNDFEVMHGIIKVRESSTGTFPIYLGGTTYKTVFGNTILPADIPLNGQVTMLAPRLQNNIASIGYMDEINNVVTQRDYQFTIIGKTLVIHAYSPNPRAISSGNYNGLFLGNVENISNPSHIEVSYIENAPIIIGGSNNNKFYVTSYIDWTRSGSNNWPSLNFVQNSNNYARSYGSSYVGGENDLVPIFDETAYVTVSKNISEAMMMVDRNSSKYLLDLKKRVTLDIWATSASDYFSDILFFDRAKSLVDTVNGYGMDSLLISFIPWMNTGTPPCYNLLPFEFPANPYWGGELKFKNLVDTSRNYGYLFTVYQNFIDMYNTPLTEGGPPGPQWNISNLVKNPDGNFRNYGFVLPSCPTFNGLPQPLVVSPDKWSYYQQWESSLIKQNYNTSAGFLDVHSKLSYPLLIDFSASNPLARSFKDVYNYDVQLFDSQKATYDGPLAGEGGGTLLGLPTDTMHAGLIDAVEGEIYQNEDTEVIPDFELRYIKPIMIRQGMGYPNRWIGLPDRTIDPATFNWDKLRATQIALGHSGFMTDHFLLNDAQWNLMPRDFNYHYQMALKVFSYWVREYYLFADFQPIYSLGNVTSILYQSPSGLVDLSEAINLNVDFSNPKLKISYDNNLIIYINRDQNPSVWNVFEKGVNYYLPSNGWLAISPNFIEYSGLMNSNGDPSPVGHRVDYVESNNYVMADGRGTFTKFKNNFTGSLNSTNLTVIKRNNLTVLELSKGNFTTSTPNYCGDNYCSYKLGESCNSCLSDCGPCNAQGYCGDNICNANIGETCSSCTQDCGACGGGSNNGGNTGSSGGTVGGNAIPQCSDNLDNDFDGSIDYPNDKGCSSRMDNTESGEFRTYNSTINNSKEDIKNKTQESEIKWVFWIISIMLVFGIIIISIIILKMIKRVKQEKIYSLMQQTNNYNNKDNI